MTTTSVVDEIEKLFIDDGDEPYGEQVTMREHMLLTAGAAENEGASDELIVACLLHDIGHLLVAPDDEYGKHTHDEIGAGWVAGHFPEPVAAPVRLHVAAKRYLCGVDSGYHDRLSPASQYTLTKQGGPMTSIEIEQFEQLSHFEDAIRLRKWEDEFAKSGDTEVPDFDRFRPLMEKLVVG